MRPEEADRAQVDSLPVITSFAGAVEVVVATLERELEGSAVWVGHLDSEREVLRVVAAGGERSFGIEPGTEAPLETSFCQVMACGAGAQLSNDAAGDPVYSALPATTALGVGSFAGAPMVFGDGTPVGTLCAFSHDACAFCDRELGLIRTFAAFLSRELEHERRLADHASVVAELRRQASTDALTGLANRRHFRDELDRAWRRSRRPGAPHSIVLVDLDDFKSINDRAGHLAGDAVLVAVGQAMRDACEPRDVVARLGGDEFAAILRGEPVAWRERLQAHLVTFDADRRVGVSVGFADLCETDSAESALSLADARLYADKRRDSLAPAA
jgi:diguanylate cyclase (GGDEF)-like protein